MSKPFRGRREDTRLVTGQGRYSADWTLPGELHACFLRSDRAHAEIVSLDVKRALAAPGVVAVLTGRDTTQAGFKTAPPMVKWPGRGGTAIKVPHRDVLANGRVRFVGQEVALVVATSVLAAQDAVEAIEIEYRDLPAVVEAEAALAAGAPQLHADIPGNVAFDFEYGDEAKTGEAFARAAHVTRLTLDSTRIAGNPMEPKACVAAYDAATDTYDLYSPTQGLSLTRAGLAGITGIPPERFRVHAHDVGGGFGIRTDAYVEYLACLLAARKLGRPVKWVSSRAETFVSDYHGRAAKLTGTLALDRDGGFLAIRFDWLVNSGAYLSQPGPVINTITPVTHAVNAYRIPVVYGRHRLVLTNTTPTTAYRGAARPNVSYLVERLVEAAARETGIDRIELRRRNLIPREAFPYKAATVDYDSGDPPGQLERALEHSQWEAFEPRRAEAARREKLRGIACAMFIEPAGASFAPKEEAFIKFGDSGNALIYALAGPSGQGHETVFPEIVAELLGLDAEKISLRASDPAGPPLVGAGTIGSRSMMSHGSAMALAAREVIRKGMDLAANELEVAASDIEFERGRYRVKGTDVAVKLETLVRKYAGASSHPLDSMGTLVTPRSFPGGAHVAEVEIDPETGVTTILRYTAVDDCGRILNHVLLEGQLHGGIIQGMGQVMGEHCIYDAAGQLLTGSFLDYTMPRAGIAPDIRLYDHSVPSPNNPLGVKGAGEAGTTGALPALALAVLDALRPLGVEHLDLPYTPARVWNAIQMARREVS
ncbi:MAG TPA: xanthine dehydrogenase family protein molybdopterin-binding subunit [Burkholderiales bacterium]|nr:xanthine dehydrogenase family protein molybdopterin-binding subunit [Burkholderiales bacterium]